MSNSPNIVYILADDMGYGDVRFLNKDCKFPTPNLDRLGQEGMYFSDAHTSSSVCTPSRYSIMTGRYCWRTYLKSGVLTGTSNALVEDERDTMASLAKRAGYNTACVGKWHLGWDWAVKPGHEAKAIRGSWDDYTQDWIDYSKPIAKSPTSYGFDYYYGISGSLDMPPYVYVENDMAVEEPTAWGSASEFLRQGPRMESLRANNVLGHITDKAVDYIHSQADHDNPFMLYFPITAPHTPISPAPAFDGISGINPYADFCMEVDHRVGQILRALKASGQDENTLVVFTTDNGASYGPSECAMLEKHYDHYCSYKYRGYKSDIWDGGHRIPFLMRWPAGVKAGNHCDQAVGIFDMYATVADITGQAIAADAGEDSVSLLPALRGESLNPDGRHALIHHSIEGRFAVRVGDWKLCRCAGSGGWASPNEKTAAENKLPEVQLYNLADDPGEKTNLWDTHPDKVKELTAVLHQCVVSGRSTPGDSAATTPELDSWDQVNWLPEIPEAFVLDD